jgi:hypothetical protein
MRDRLSALRGSLRSTATKLSRKVLNKYIDIGIFFEDLLNKDVETVDLKEVLEEVEGSGPGDELDLNPLHDFMSDYIGMMVIGVKGFAEDTILEEAASVQCKIVTDCKLVGESIELHLNDVGGKPSGYLRLSPSKHGSFAERDSGEIPLYSSRYRIFFYGGDTLEYLDTEKMGSIEFFGGE